MGTAAPITKARRRQRRLQTSRAVSSAFLAGSLVRTVATTPLMAKIKSQRALGSRCSLVKFCAGVEHSIARPKHHLHKSLVIRAGYLIAGFISLALGALGLALPLLPTVPFVILAAFCFARSSPALERRLVEHRTFGPHINSWRTRGAISRSGKRAAAAAFAFSAAMGFVLLDAPWSLVPAAAAAVGGTWVLTRPS